MDPSRLITIFKARNLIIIQTNKTITRFLRSRSLPHIRLINSRVSTLHSSDTVGLLRIDRKLIKIKAIRE